jgi:integrase/recombinase XerD
MLLSKAIEGFILDGLAGTYSPSTIKLYQICLRLFIEHHGDCELDTITPDILSAYMGYLRNEYKPHRLHPSDAPLSPSALDNHWKCLRAFFGWGHKILGLKRPDLNLPRQSFKLPEIIPFTQEELRRIFNACEYTKVASGRTPYRMKRPTAARDKALVYLLLDTGLRVGEVTRLRIEDIDLSNGEVHVAPYGSGQKTKPRTVFLGKVSRRAVWYYLSSRDYRLDEPLFKLSDRNIRLLLLRMGERANVPNVHPHRFRHTFAIYYLRNGGDVFTLQRLLGHSSLDMVQHYLALADTDTAEAHRRASPVDRL